MRKNNNTTVQAINQEQHLNTIDLIDQASVAEYQKKYKNIRGENLVKYYTNSGDNPLSYIMTGCKQNKFIISGYDYQEISFNYSSDCEYVSFYSGFLWNPI